MADAAHPGLTEATRPNHIFAYELAPDPLPLTRHAFMVQLVQSGVLKEPSDSMRQVGLAPWAIQESAELEFAGYYLVIIGVPSRIDRDI